MQCPACDHEGPVSSYGDPLRCPECGAFYEKALLLKQRKQLSVEKAASVASSAPLKSASTGATAVGLEVPAYIKGSLSSGEQVEAVFKLHWASWISVWLWGLAALLTAGLLAPVAIYAWLSLRCLEQGLTNKRVIVKRGIISRITEEMKLGSIETVELKQGVLGRIFGFGNVKVTGRGISDVVYRSIDDPMGVKRRIESVSHPMV